MELPAFGKERDELYMPIFRIVCEKCGLEHERLMSRTDFNEDGLCICPSCLELAARKMPAAFAAHYKGTGFYTTDYARKSSNPPTPNQKNQ